MSIRERVSFNDALSCFARIFFFFFFWIQFNVPFKIISLIETSQSIGGAKREYPGKPPDAFKEL